MSRRMAAGWMLLGLFVLACGWSMSRRHPVAAAAGVGAHAASMPVAGNADRPAPATGIAAPSPLHAINESSLRGSQVDGAVSVGFGGHLQPNLSLRHLFDYYLNLIGESDLPGIRRLLQNELIGRQLATPLIDETLQTFDRYVRTQQATAMLASQPGLSLPQRLAKMDALRRQMLGDALDEAFYPDQQAQQKQLLQRLAIETGGDLPPAERARRLQALDASLPAAEQQLRAQASAGQTVQMQSDRFDAEQADAATRHAARAQQWGPAAADRLAALDQQRAQWQGRLDAYARASEAIRTDPSLGEAQRRAALTQLLQQSFQGPEQMQVQAMDQDNLLGAAAH